MKKFFTAICTAIILTATAISISGCSESKLKAAVKIANQNCPTTIDEGLVFTKITLESDNVVYIISIDEDIYPIESLSLGFSVMGDETKAGILSSMADDNDVIELYKLCVETNKSIVYRYVGNQTNESIDLTFPVSVISRFI